MKPCPRPIKVTVLAIATLLLVLGSAYAAQPSAVDFDKEQLESLIERVASDRLIAEKELLRLQQEEAGLRADLDRLQRATE